MTSNDRNLVKIIILAAEAFYKGTGEEPIGENASPLGKFIIAELIRGIHGEYAGLDTDQKALVLMRTAQSELEIITEELEAYLDKYTTNESGWDGDQAQIMRWVEEDWDICKSEL